MPTPPLVGRELDLAVALEQLKRVEGGGGAALLVRGEAGIGKSRLVAEVEGRARRLGYAVLTGRADDLDRGIPYAVVRDLLARLLLDRGEQADGGLRGALDGDVTTADPGADHLQAVFGATVRLLRSVSGDRPALVVLEDLHAADPESVALLAPLVRLADARVLMVVTLRPRIALDVERLMEQMAGDGRGAVIDLDPLDRHDTQALVASVLGAAPDDPLVDAVFGASHGNPFFAVEAAQSLSDAGAVAVDGGRARLVPGTPAVGLRPSTSLLRRLFAGMTVDVELAKVMSVCGRFPLRRLALARHVTGQSAEETERAFDRLVKSGLVIDTAAGYEFAHSIVRDTLYEDIGPAERRRIHAAVAAQLASERRAGIVLDVLELATHVAESAEVGDEAAAGVLMDAGRSVAVTAPLVSAEYQRRAVALLPAASPLRAEALALQARELHLGSRPFEASMVGREALAVIGSGSARLSMVSIVASGLYVAGRVGEALDVVEDELRRSSSSGDPAAAALLGLRVGLLFQSDRFGEAALLLPDALLSLTRANPAAQMIALSHLVQYANHVGNVDLAAELFARLPLRGSRTVELAGHELIAMFDWRPGLVERTAAHLDAAGRLRADPVGMSIGGASEAAQLRLHWIAGRWDQALELMRTASFDLDQRGGVVPAQLLLGAAAEILIDRGALDDASAIAAQLVTPVMSLRRNAALVRARLARALGDDERAISVLESERVTAASGSVWKLADLLHELATLFGDAKRPDDARETLADLDRLASEVGWPECRLPALSARAVVERSVDAARDHLALAGEESWEVARAHALLHLGELGEDPGPTLGEAYRLFDGFGAAPLRRRAAAALRARGLTVPRRVAKATSELSETETALVRLVCEGLSNRQIAAALHYSTKTIEVYLSRLYAKTGCGSRLALMRAVDSGAVTVER